VSCAATNKGGIQMKKKVSLLVFTILMNLHFAFADVVSLTDGYYRIGDSQVEFTTVWTILSVVILCIVSAIVAVICKKAKTKKTKIISIVLGIIVVVTCVLVLPALMPSPGFNHGLVPVDF
jgi:Na+/proline symporter